LKRQVAAWHTRLWWDYPPCRPAPNKHTYFTILQIVESAFRTSTCQDVSPLNAVIQTTIEYVSTDTCTYFNFPNSGMCITSVCRNCSDCNPLGL